MSRRSLLRAIAVLALACPVPVMSAPPVQAQELVSGMTPFLPPPPAGWEAPMGPNVREDDNGLEPAVGQAYGPSSPNERGMYVVTINHPSAHDLAVAYPPSRPLGPNPMAPWMVTSHVKVNDLDAYLIYNQEAGSGILQMKVGRVSVGIQGGERTPEQIVAFARTMDTDRLLKY